MMGCPLIMLQQIRRRDLILLTGLFSLAAITVIAIALLIIRYNSTLAADSEQNPALNGQSTYTIAYQQITGMKQYDLAEKKARTWADDAQLVVASTDWPQVINLEQVGQPSEWSYHFYSPAKKQKFIVIVHTDGQVRTFEPPTNNNLIPRTIATNNSSWMIDSPEALAIWLDYGGYDMLQSNPNLELMMQLRGVKERVAPVWMVVGLNNQTQKTHAVVIDAAQGTIIQVIR